MNIQPEPLEPSTKEDWIRHSRILRTLIPARPLGSSMSSRDRYERILEGHHSSCGLLCDPEPTATCTCGFEAAVNDLQRHFDDVLAELTACAVLVGTAPEVATGLRSMMVKDRETIQGLLAYSTPKQDPNATVARGNGVAQAMLIRERLERE